MRAPGSALPLSETAGRLARSVEFEMAKPSALAKSVIAAHGDAIRTVPLYVAGGAGTPTLDKAASIHAVAPRLTYETGRC